MSTVDVIARAAMTYPESDCAPRPGSAAMCWICSGSATLLFMTALPCHADEAPQVVEIVGVRAAAESAQQAKRRRDEISDSVVADDIDKLPDISIADALQRITGVQIGRDRGEGTGVVVRGLSQLETTLDGREVFTAGTTRALDFAELPAELVAGLDVIKTTSPDRIEGGVGGQIDVRTRHPFDFSGDATSATVRQVHASLAGQGDTQFSALASRRFATGIGDVGVLLAGAHQAKPWREDQKNVGNPISRTDLVPGLTVLAPNGTSETTSIGRRDRDSVQAVVQWRPDAAWELFAEANATQLRTTQDSYQINVTASPTFDPASVALFPGTNDLEHITWTNAPISVLSFARDTVDRTWLGAVGGQWRHGDLSARADLSRTFSYDNLFFSGPFFAGTAARFTQDLSTSVPGTSVEGTDLLAPANFQYTGVAYRLRPFDGALNTLRFDTELALHDTWISSVSAGLRLARREANDGTGLVFGDVAVTGLSVADLPGLAMPNPYANFLPGASAPSLDNFLVNNLAQAHDPAALRALFGITTPLPTTGSPTGLWRIAERTDAGYVMGRIDAFESSLHGNFGLRIVQTGEVVSGNESITGSSDVLPIGQSARYTDLLPSFNLRQAIGADRYVRLSASRTITRPNFDQMSPSLELLPNSVDPSLNSGTAGNPALRPIRSEGVDLALETYPGRSTAASLTVFAKHVDGFVTSISQPETYDGVTYQVSRPQNGGGAQLHGVELAYQQFYTSLPGWLAGLGLQANATIVASKTPSQILGGNVPLTNLSRRSANVVAMYEREDVSVRIAWNWRDRFLNGVTSVVGVGALPGYTAAYGWLDASFAWRFNQHVSITLAGSNLLDARRHSYWGVQTRPQSAWVDDVLVTAALTLRL
jgi:iron complex outermembrane receptor protein